MPHQLGQFPQASGMQRRTPSGHFHQDVRFHKIGPDRWDFAQVAALIMEVQIALGKNTTVFNKVKLLATQRMKRMGNPKAATSFASQGCNRESIRTSGHSAGPAQSPRAPAPPAGQTRNACPAPRAPARGAPAARPPPLRPARASSAALSCLALQHRHQRPHVPGVEPPPPHRLRPFRSTTSRRPSPVGGGSAAGRARTPVLDAGPTAARSSTVGVSFTSTNLVSGVRSRFFHHQKCEAPYSRSRQNAPTLCPLRACSEINFCHFRRAFLLRSRCVIGPASSPASHDATLPHTPARCASHTAHQ